MANYDSDPIKVKAVQTAINAAGYTPPLVVDGQYGPKTAAGVKWYQGQHGLTQDGIIGDATMAATIAAVPGSGAPALIPPVLSLPGVMNMVNSLNPTPPPPASVYVPPASSGPNLPLLGLPPAAMPPAAMALIPPAASAVVHPASAKAQLPAWAGTAAGLVVGLAGGAVAGSVLAGAVIGGALGGMVDMVRSSMAPGATMHGEPMFGGEDEGIIAGEIGVPARDTCTLKG